jgi:hypothetical protein
MKTMPIPFFNIKDIVHFEFVPRCQTVNQAYYMKILKWLCEVVHRERPELWPSDWILHHDNATTHKALSFKQFLAQKLIIEMEHIPCSPDLGLNDFWLFIKIKSTLKGWRFQDVEDIQKESDSGTESCSTTGVPKMFPAVGALLVYMHSY